MGYWVVGSMRGWLESRKSEGVIGARKAKIGRGWRERKESRKEPFGLMIQDNSSFCDTSSSWVKYQWERKAFELRLTFTSLCQSKTLFYYEEEYPRCEAEILHISHRWHGTEFISQRSTLEKKKRESLKSHRISMCDQLQYWFPPALDKSWAQYGSIYF